MIRHVVAFKLKAREPAERVMNADGIRDRLSALVGAIPGLRSVSVGHDLGVIDTHWDAVLISEHDSNAALEGYQAHPLHVEAAAWISTVVTDRAVVDYEP
jgi:hypothetical protein